MKSRRSEFCMEFRLYTPRQRSGVANALTDRGRKPLGAAVEVMLGKGPARHDVVHENLSQRAAGEAVAPVLRLTTEVDRAVPFVHFDLVIWLKPQARLTAILAEMNRRAHFAGSPIAMSKDAVAMEVQSRVAEGGHETAAGDRLNLG